MIMLIINLALSVLIMAVIGWQAKAHVFPFRSWSQKPDTVWDWVTCVFIIYNLYVIVSTYLSIGPFTVIGLAYAIIMVAAFIIGYDGPAIRDFINQARSYGFRSAVDQWKRLHTK